MPRKIIRLKNYVTPDVIAREWMDITGAHHVQLRMFSNLEGTKWNILKFWADGRLTLVQLIHGDTINNIDGLRSVLLKFWEREDHANKPWNPPLDLSDVEGEDWADLCAQSY